MFLKKMSACIDATCKFSLQGQLGMSNYFYLSILTKWVLLKIKVGKKKQSNISNVEKKAATRNSQPADEENWTSLLMVERRCVKNLKYGNTQKFYQVSWKN